VTKLVKYGQLKQEKSFKLSKATTMKYFLELSTTKETPLSPVQRIIPAEFGKMSLVLLRPKQH